MSQRKKKSGKPGTPSRRDRQDTDRTGQFSQKRKPQGGVQGPRQGASGERHGSFGATAERGAERRAEHAGSRQFGATDQRDSRGARNDGGYRAESPRRDAPEEKFPRSRTPRDRDQQRGTGPYWLFGQHPVTEAIRNPLRKIQRLVRTTGAEGEALARAVAGGRVKLTVLLCQLVKLFRDGEPVRMSKRAGEFVTLRDVVEEVGRDAIRFMMLYRKSDAPLDFDFARVTEQSKDNPVFYVQYASARCHSVFRQARGHVDADAGDRTKLKKFVHLLTDEGEIGLIRKLAGRQGKLHFCYEAGPTGYGLYRQLEAPGHPGMRDS